MFSLALALSEDFLAICGTWLELKWAAFLNKIGMFERWKKKGERIQDAIKKRRVKLDELYPKVPAAPAGDDNA
jgi:hypothetical protein